MAGQANHEWQIEAFGDQGWRIYSPDCRDAFYVTRGGTGPCWNLHEDDSSYADPIDAGSIHVYELDDLIEALQAFRRSGIYEANLERWGCQRDR